MNIYKPVRNLRGALGPFLDASDVDLRQKVALLTEKLAKRLYGSQNAAIGQTIKIHGLQFTVIGTFKEKVESFGQSELNAETVLIPITVQQYFMRVERIDPLYVQVRSPQDVEAGNGAGAGDTRKPPPRGRDLQSRKSDGDSECREKHLGHAEPGAGAGFGNRAGDFRHRHHEHHAGDGDGADARDRRAHGGGRIAQRNSACSS